MARQPRTEFDGARYHVMARGDRREDIVQDDQDREMFVKTLAEACAMTGWEIQAWVLMSNHYHLVIKTPQANLVAGMKWFQNAYTRRFNSRHKLWGHIFGGRYKSILVEEGIYLRHLIDYVHLNPVRAALVKIRYPEDLLSYEWSSLSGGYSQTFSRREKWLDASDRLEIGPDKEREKHRKAYLKHLHGIAVEEGKKAGTELPEGQSLHSTLQRGWVWGSEAFKEQMLKKQSKKASRNVNYQGSPLNRDRQGKEADDWIKSGLKVAGLTLKELKALKPSHPAKVAVAAALKARTTTANGWIAEQLSMRNAGNVSQLSRRHRRGEIVLPKEWKEWLENVKNA